ncbi:MAG: Rid family detoxifying hydrolase [Christensenellaceae bacterium]|jgi:2-iminobutanoate/2-iminopropanoate deaminase|nr:Rid family detoxifying hydrolase [Christensenellaceae bacterium]
MAKKEIKGTIAAVGPYSAAVESGNLVFVSGQLPINAASGTMPDGAAAQAKESLANLKGVLENAGLTTANVVKTTVFLKNIADFAAVNEVYASFFTAPYPARSAVEVANIPKGALVEIEAIAIKA